MLRKRLTMRSAFTLVEVMVVTGIMMSQANNYGDVKRIAYQQSCENNMRQLYQAFLMYDMTNDGLPRASFFPKNPRADAASLVNVLDGAYAACLVCPVFPQAIREKGLTYIYNDTLAGTSLGSLPNARQTWLLMEMNAVSEQVPLPHPAGFHILFADGHIERTKTIPAFFSDMQKKAAERDAASQTQSSSSQ